MKRILILLLCVCLCTCSGCKETVSSDSNTGKTMFTKEEFLEDYEFLWDTLEEEYIFLRVVEEQGIDLAALREDTKNRILDKAEDIDGFVALLDSMFSQMYNLAHLSVVTPEVYDLTTRVCNEDTTNSQWDGWRMQLENPQTQVIYTYLKEHGKKAGTGKTEGGMEASYDFQRKAVTFKIRSFDDSYVQQDRTAIEDYLEALDGAAVEHIIFDITGNLGGNTDYWMENIVAPFGGSYEWVTWSYLRDTPLAKSYFFENDAYDPKPLAELPEGHTAPAFTQELALTHFIRSQGKITGEATLDKDILKARRWVLINGRVYSAAESFSAFCKETGWATLVGQTTMGDGGGGNPIFQALPNTGVLVRFTGRAVENPDGGLNVLKGTSPDYKVSVFEAPSAAVNRLIDAE